jgi:hypothetical protein
MCKKSLLIAKQDLGSAVGWGEPAISAGPPHQSRSFATDAVRDFLKDRNLPQIVARISCAFETFEAVSVRFAHHALRELTSDRMER